MAGESACRPGSVHPLARADGHPSGTAVADSLVRPTREHRAGRPRSLAQEAVSQGSLPFWPCSGWGLPSRPSHLERWWSLTPPFHPYLPRPEPGGGLFSVALSRGSPRVGVTDHPALRSPDLPRHTHRAARPPGRLARHPKGIPPAALLGPTASPKYTGPTGAPAGIISANAPVRPVDRSHRPGGAARSAGTVRGWLLRCGWASRPRRPRGTGPRPGHAARLGRRRPARRPGRRMAPLAGRSGSRSRPP